MKFSGRNSERIIIKNLQCLERDLFFIERYCLDEFDSRQVEDIVKPELPPDTHEDTKTGQSTPDSPLSACHSNKQAPSEQQSHSDNKSAIIPISLKKFRAKRRPKRYVLKEEYIDIIKDAFWESKPWILQ